MKERTAITVPIDHFWISCLDSSRPDQYIDILCTIIYFLCLTRSDCWCRYLLLLFHILNLWVHWTLRLMIWPYLSSMLCSVSLLEYFFYVMCNWTHTVQLYYYYYWSFIWKTKLLFRAPFNNIKPNFISHHFSTTISHSPFTIDRIFFLSMTITSRI